MRALMVSVTLFLTGLSPSLQSTEKMAPPKQNKSIPLYLSSSRALVMLRVGSNPPVPVVFDTGTNGNLVDIGLAERFSLPNTGPSPSIDGSTGKPVPGYDTFITHAQLGGVPIEDARATALKYDKPDEVGIFGPNSFPGQLVRMDGPNSCLVLMPRSETNLPKNKPFTYLGEDGDALPSATLDFGEIKIQAILDSGNDMPIILPMSYANKIPLATPLKKVGFAVSAAGRQPIFSARLKDAVKIGDFKLSQPEIYFMEGGRPNVGLPVLKQLSILFDPTNKVDWVM